MAEPVIAPELQDFILRHIDSITQLEALLLLRANPGERWHPGNAAARLYSTEHDVEAVLSRLCANRLLRCEDGIYSYDPQPPERREVVDRLASVYVRHLIPVADLIHDKERRIHAFAQAFRVRGDR